MSGDLQYERLCALKCACEERKNGVLLSKEEAVKSLNILESFVKNNCVPRPWVTHGVDYIILSINKQLEE